MNRKAASTKVYVDMQITKLKRYVKVVEPINTFSLITQTLHQSLQNLEYNKLIEFEEEIWPKLLKNIKTFDNSETPESIDLLQSKFKFEIPEKKVPEIFTTSSQVESLIDLKLSQFQPKKSFAKPKKDKD